MDKIFAFLCLTVLGMTAMMLNIQNADVIVSNIISGIIGAATGAALTWNSLRKIPPVVSAPTTEKEEPPK